MYLLNRFTHRAYRVVGIFFLFLLTVTQFQVKALLPEAFAQTAESPTALPVFGGRIQAIEAVAIHPDTTRVFISTESANSLFYADVVHGGTTATFSTFHTVPDFDSLR